MYGFGWSVVALIQRCIKYKSCSCIGTHNAKNIFLDLSALLVLCSHCAKECSENINCIENLILIADFDETYIFCKSSIYTIQIK